LGNAWIAVDPADPHALYVSYVGLGTRFAPGPEPPSFCPRIPQFLPAYLDVSFVEAVRSRDAGVTWSAAIAMDETCEGVFASDTQTGVGVRGRVYVTWTRPAVFLGDSDTQILLSKSIDGGASFAPPVRVANPIGFGTSVSIGLGGDFNPFEGSVGELLQGLF